MRRLAGLATASIAAAVLAGGAAGKAPPQGILICGQSACKAILQADAEHVLISLYGSATQPAAPAPSYVLRWQWNAPEQRVWWVPRGGLIRGADGGWKSLSVTSEQLLGEWAAGLAPYPAPTITRAEVGGRVAENPQSYLRLLRGGELSPSFDGARGFVGVRLASLDPSPWTNGATWVMVSRARGFVWRDVWVYRVSPALAERARRGLSLTPFSRAG